MTELLPSTAAQLADIREDARMWRLDHHRPYGQAERHVDALLDVIDELQGTVNGEPITAESEDDAEPTTSQVVTETIARVLAEHSEARWSNGTFGCHGCFQRVRAAQEAAPAETEHDRLTAQRELTAALDPGWSHAQWRTHVAEQIATALTAIKETP